MARKPRKAKPSAAKRPAAKPPALNPQVAQAASSRLNDWVNRIYGVAAMCLFGLALMVIFGIEAPLLRWLLVGGIFLAGTGAIMLQSRRVCPACGNIYGYHLRFVNANKCRKCGTQLPDWRPGREGPA